MVLFCLLDTTCTGCDPQEKIPKKLYHKLAFFFTNLLTSVHEHAKKAWLISIHLDLLLGQFNLYILLLCPFIHMTYMEEQWSHS